MLGDAAVLVWGHARSLVARGVFDEVVTHSAGASAAGWRALALQNASRAAMGPPWVWILVALSVAFWQRLADVQTKRMPLSVIGRRSTGVPVAAKIALAMAGPVGGRPGSPAPVGASAEGMTCTSISGISYIRVGS